MKLTSYRDLIVWQKSIDLVVLIYKFTDTFPEGEKFGLTSQMRRAVISIPSNIAEGKYRGTQKDFRHFITLAFGSGGELETQLEIAKRLHLGTKDELDQIDELLLQVMKMLNKLMASLK